MIGEAKQTVAAKVLVLTILGLMVRSHVTPASTDQPNFPFLQAAQSLPDSPLLRATFTETNHISAGRDGRGNVDERERIVAAVRWSSLPPFYK